MIFKRNTTIMLSTTVLKKETRRTKAIHIKRNRIMKDQSIQKTMRPWKYLNLARKRASLPETKVSSMMNVKPSHSNLSKECS